MSHEITPEMTAGFRFVADLIEENRRLKEEAYKRECWLRSAKLIAGYHSNVSFDVVWNDALDALLEKRQREL